MERVRARSGTAAALVAGMLVAGVLGLGACAGAEPEQEPAGRPGGPPPSSAPSVSSPAAQPRTPGPGSRPVVVGHATRPQLHLDRGTARRLGSGEVDRWRGLRVVADLPPNRAIAAVERDPATIAVVPLRAVGPTVLAATVAGRDPVRDHPGAVDVTVAGDLMLVRGVPDPAAALAPTRWLLRGADLTVGNLESTLSTAGPPTQGDDSFGGGPGLVEVLADAGFDAVSLANNHTGDHGPAALVQTVARLRDGPVTGFGAGRDLREALRPAVLEAGGLRLAFLGFNAIGETPAATADTPGALSVRMPPRTGPLVAADLARVTAAVRRADRRADAVVVLPHWGTQYTHAPEPVQRLVARRLVAAGADLVVGGHPHWVQGVDAVAGVPVLHSLGNFVFDMDFMTETLEGVLLETTWWSGRLRALRLVPYVMDPVSFAPRVVTGERAEAVLADVRSTSTGPFRP